MLVELAKMTVSGRHLAHELIAPPKMRKNSKGEHLSYEYLPDGRIKYSDGRILSLDGKVSREDLADEISNRMGAPESG